MADWHGRPLECVLGDGVPLRFEKVRIEKIKGKKCLQLKLSMGYNGLSKRLIR